MEANGYKAVIRDDDVLKSIIMWGYSSLCVIYEPGHPARGDIGPLMFFPELHDARSFVNTLGEFDGSKYEIWSCVATNVRMGQFMARGLAVANTRRIERDLKEWWKIANATTVKKWSDWADTAIALRELFSTTELPEGTWVADTVTLVERVNR